MGGDDCGSRRTSAEQQLEKHEAYNRRSSQPL
jgi:hypothetical protein